MAAGSENISRTMRQQRIIITGHDTGVIEHHYPEMNPTGEKFTFVRLKYPGGDWYTNIVNYYSLAIGSEIYGGPRGENTTIDVEVRENPQYVDIDDEGLCSRIRSFL